MLLDDVSMTIGGSSVRGASTLAVENPATGEIIAQSPAASPEQLDMAFAAAARAARPWRTDSDAREQVMIAAADAVNACAAELADLITLEQGKPLAEAHAEVLGTVVALRYFASQRLTPTVLSDRPGPRVVVRRRPVGVVAAITPWNSPIMVAGALKIAPALAAGNTIVVKPSPFTPLATLRLGRVLATVLPPGVVNVISGGNELGAMMTSHSVPSLITFTGSSGVGRLVAQSAARDMKRAILELGGNDPAIVLDDVEVDDVAEALFWGAFGNAGQTCVAIKRVYVPQALHGKLVDALASIAASVRVGDGRDPATQMGPLTTSSQRDIVSDLVSAAANSGGRIVTGGSALKTLGTFYAPTIIDRVSDGDRIVDEEQFGPALPIVAYDDVDDVLGKVNASQYGLGGSVWSSDPLRGREVADRLDAGTTWVNTHRGSLWPIQPTAGLRHSGLGAELGTWGLEHFTDLSVQHDAVSVNARPVGLVLADEG
jgi:acyl-CoA reductase-like NAD-dependent aldehyde dehydrogenase